MYSDIFRRNMQIVHINICKNIGQSAHIKKYYCKYNMKQNNANYVSTKKAKQILGVHTSTLRNWDKYGKINTIRSVGNHRLYDVNKFLQYDRKKNATDIIYVMFAYPLLVRKMIWKDKKNS